MYKVSIIVPLYNVQDYIENCVDSLVNQTYKNIEIILVNDGSTDNSGEVAKKLATTDDRIKYIEQENGGLARARNIGFKNASADWIVNCDPDDWYDLNAIELLVDAQVKHDVNMVIASARLSFKTEKAQKNRINELSGEVVNAQQALENLYYIKDTPGESQWAKLFRKQDLLIYPNPPDYIHEDAAVIHWLLHVSGKIYFSYDKIYNYYQRVGSIMNSSYTPNSLLLLDALNDHRTGILYMAPHNKSLIKAWLYKYVNSSKHILTALAMDKHAKFIGFMLNEARLFSFFVAFNRKLKLSERLEALRFTFFPYRTMKRAKENMRKNFEHYREKYKP